MSPWGPSCCGPLLVHVLGVGGFFPAWRPAPRVQRREQRPAHRQSLPGRGAEEMGLSGYPGPPESRGGGGGTVKLAAGDPEPGLLPSQAGGPSSVYPWPPGLPAAGMCRGARGSTDLHLSPVPLLALAPLPLPWSQGPGAQSPTHMSPGSGTVESSPNKAGPPRDGLSWVPSLEQGPVRAAVRGVPWARPCLKACAPAGGAPAAGPSAQLRARVSLARKRLPRRLQGLENMVSPADVPESRRKAWPSPEGRRRRWPRRAPSPDRQAQGQGPRAPAGCLLGGGVPPQERKLWTCRGAGAGADCRVGEALPGSCLLHCLWGLHVPGVGSCTPCPPPRVSAQAQALPPPQRKIRFASREFGVNSCDECNYNVSV